MYAVVVTFLLKPGQAERFLPPMLKNAATSLRAEPGCHQFDVATDPARKDEVLLYELYSDRDAFDDHLASEHFRLFDTAVADMIESKEIRCYAEVRG
ncbi:MAG: antibiotic biosynthesis monooxygenase [Tabrizicola sp.]|nr:antibiotic biosynthesis monooxygenase [Tabrizicola sp.]